ncbi:hypothetical protein [Thalassotalea ganghwensis]
MHREYQTLKHLLGFSWLTSSLIVVLLLVFQYLLTTSVENWHVSAELMKTPMMMASVVCSFMGMFLGAALRVFRGHYLWQVNNSYRRHLASNALFILLAINLSFLWPLLINISANTIAVFIPFCVGLCALNLTFADKVTARLLWPLVPAILYQLQKLHIDFNYLIILLYIIGSYLSIHLFSRKGYSTKHSTLAPENTNTSDIALVNVINKINTLIGGAIKDKLMNSNADLSWALTDPLNRIGLYAVAHSLALVIFLFLLGGQTTNAYENLVLLFVAMTPLSVILHARKHIKQLRTIAHLYTGKNFVGFKQAVLSAMYRLIVFDCAVLLGFAFLGVHLLGYNVSLTFMVVIALSVIIALVIVPLFILLNWHKVNLPLVGFVCGYFAIIISISAYYKGQTSSFLLSNQHILSIVGFIAFAGILLVVSRFIYKKADIEKVLDH